MVDILDTCMFFVFEVCEFLFILNQVFIESSSCSKNLKNQTQGLSFSTKQTI